MLRETYQAMSDLSDGIVSSGRWDNIGGISFPRFRYRREHPDYSGNKRGGYVSRFGGYQALVLAKVLSKKEFSKKARVRWVLPTAQSAYDKLQKSPELFEFLGGYYMPLAHVINRDSGLVISSPKVVEENSELTFKGKMTRFQKDTEDAVEILKQAGVLKLGEGRRPNGWIDSGHRVALAFAGANTKHKYIHIAGSRPSDTSWSDILGLEKAEA